MLDFYNSFMSMTAGMLEPKLIIIFYAFTLVYLFYEWLVDSIEYIRKRGKVHKEVTGHMGLGVMYIAIVFMKLWWFFMHPIDEGATFGSDLYTSHILMHYISEGLEWSFLVVGAFQYALAEHIRTARRKLG